MNWLFFFFNDTATTEIYTLSLHDALPISACFRRADWSAVEASGMPMDLVHRAIARESRSEEHTSELQSRLHLVCRLLLEKKKNNTCPHILRPVTTLNCVRTRRVLRPSTHD